MLAGRRLRPVAALVLVTLIAGCSDYTGPGRETITTSAGAAMHFNSVAHTVEICPKEAAKVEIDGYGPVVAAAIARYRSGEDSTEDSAPDAGAADDDAQDAGS